MELVNNINICCYIKNINILFEIIFFMKLWLELSCSSELVLFCVGFGLCIFRCGEGVFC